MNVSELLFIREMPIELDHRINNCVRIRKDKQLTFLTQFSKFKISFSHQETLEEINKMFFFLLLSEDIFK